VTLDFHLADPGNIRHLSGNAHRRGIAALEYCSLDIQALIVSSVSSRNEVVELSANTQSADVLKMPVERK
jgi:hypothetical protein